MRKRKTHEEFVKEVFERFEDEYKVIGTYKTSTTKINILHNICGEMDLISPESLFRRKNCAYCTGQKKSHRMFVKEVYDLVGDEYSVIGKYKDTHAKITLTHNKCGRTWDIKPSNFLHGQRCKPCSMSDAHNKQTKTHETFIKEVQNLVGDEYSVLEPYKSAKTKIRIQHNVCDHIWLITPDKFLHDKRCPPCANKRVHDSQRRTQKEFEELVSQVGNDEYIVLGKYVNANEKIEFKHKVCGHTFHMKANHFTSSGSRCPKCKESKGEKLIGECLDSENISYRIQHRFNDCRNQKTLPFDFAIFEDNKLTKIIEYDGEFHFLPIAFSKNGEVQAKERLLKTQENDKLKNEYCRDNNIPLYRIPYWKFDDIENILHKIIHNKPLEVDKTSFLVL